MQAGENLGQVPPFAEFHTDGAVAAEATGAGEDKIAHAGEAGKRFAMTAAGDGETGHLRHATGNKGSGGVCPQLQTRDHARGERDDVFQGTTELGADHTAVYRHFRDKDAIMLAVGDHVTGEIYDAVIATTDPGDPWQDRREPTSPAQFTSALPLLPLPQVPVR